MAKRMLYIFLSLVGLYIVLQLLKPFMPDWLRILLNADPRYLDDAVHLAKETYKYDHKEK